MRSEVEEIALLLVFLVLIAVAVSLIINFSGNFLTSLRGISDRIIKFVQQIV